MYLSQNHRLLLCKAPSLISVNVLSLLLIWSHPWRDTDWFMADVCSLMKSNHAIGLLSQLFVRLFWCSVLSCHACDVVCRVQASSTRFCLSLKCTDQFHSMNSNHFSLMCKYLSTIFTRKVIRSQDNYIIIIGALWGKFSIQVSNPYSFKSIWAWEPPHHPLLTHHLSPGVLL